MAAIAQKIGRDKKQKKQIMRLTLRHRIVLKTR